MNWSSIRDFLSTPKHLTGKGVSIAIIDGGFTFHPDIISNKERNSYLVKAHTTEQEVFKNTVKSWSSRNIDSFCCWRNWIFIKW